MLWTKIFIEEYRKYCFDIDKIVNEMSHFGSLSEIDPNAMTIQN